MKLRTFSRLAFVAVVMTAVAQFALAEGARLSTFTKSSGETFFALSVNAPEQLAPAAMTDVLVLLDTSASQTSVYRDDSLAMLDATIAELNALPQAAGKARVKLVAVDVRPVEMTADFVATDSADWKAGVEKLHRRAPLGSTDLPAALNYAASSFSGSGDHPRRVIYIGDGLSRMNLLQTDEFRAAIDALVQNQVSVSSFAIGPQRDIFLLATIANHTGGNVYVDGNDASSQQAGATVARMAIAPVVWPSDVSLTDNFVEVYPAHFPPLRGDRSSVVIGALDGPGTHEIKFTGHSPAGEVKWQWEVTPETSLEDNFYLASLVDSARADEGLTLATLGDRSLELMRSVAQSGARDLTELSERALASGDHAGAKRLAEAALKVDPGSTIAETVRDAAVKNSGAQGDTGEAGARGEPAIRLAAYQAEGGGLLDAFQAEEGAFLEEVENQKRLQTEIIQAEVEHGLGKAREIFDVNPAGAIADLKVLLQNIERAPDLAAEIRAQLRDRIVSAIKEAQRQQVEKDERDQLRAEQQAAAQERQRIIREAERREEKVNQIIARYNSLMDEGRYRDAEAAAYEARDIVPRDPAITSAILTSRMTGYTRDMMAVREARQKGVIDALFQVERANVPFADEPPITYPDPQVWEELTLRRKKYASVDLKKQGGSEEQIFNALDDATTLEFIETPLQDVVDYLKDLHGIEIQIDHRALEDVGIGSDTPITRNLKGISLRSALRLMLKEMDLTYVVRDEVLLITTPEEAESELTTKVYPVADLVLPISSGAGANPFSLGGGIGGQGGFGGGLGGGGGGQAGGGLGGGGGFGGGGGGLGGGLGGGGGVFNVEDEIRLGTKSQDAVKAEVAKPQADARPAFQPRKRTVAAKPVTPHAYKAKVIELTIADDQDPQEAWDAYFAAHRDQPFDPADVRETARKLMSEGKFAEDVAFIQAALKNGQPQPWMYEALYLAMSAQDAPAEDVERALLSAVDFSDNVLDLMYVAAYMSRVGMEDRALQLFAEVAAAQPSQPESYIQALDIADRTDNYEAAQWATLGVLRQAWPASERRLEDKARRLAIAVVHHLEKQGKTEEAKAFKNELDYASMRDVRVEVHWTGDADLDMLVEEPSGTVCSFRNQRTSAGGVMLGDTASRSDLASASGYKEVYVCPQGFAGNYRLLLRRVWGKVTTGNATVHIYTNYKSSSEEVFTKEIPLGEKDAVITFSLNRGRRLEPLADHKLAVAARTQVAVSRAVLAQQLNTVTDSEAARDFARDRRLAARDGRLVLPGRRNVGFQPQITTLPEGANMTATAVISADRRYVRITAVPIFSLIGEVNTFNIQNGDFNNITDEAQGDMDPPADMMDIVPPPPPPF